MYFNITHYIQNSRQAYYKNDTSNSRTSKLRQNPRQSTKRKPVGCGLRITATAVTSLLVQFYVFTGRKSLLTFSIYIVYENAINTTDKIALYLYPCDHCKVTQHSRTNCSLFILITQRQQSAMLREVRQSVDTHTISTSKRIQQNKQHMLENTF
jgi:hypothetical protein